MLEKELNELSDETILTLYKSVVPSTSIIESVNKKLEKQSADGILRNKKEQGKTSESDFKADKTFLNFQRHLIELKLLSVKILEETDLLIPLIPPAIGDCKPCSSSILFLLCP